MSKIEIIVNVDEQNMPHVEDYLNDERSVRKGVIEGIGGIPGGMKSGKTSVCLSIKLSDGSWVFAETSLKMLQISTAALSGRYGNETDDPTILAWVEGSGKPPKRN